MKSICVFMGLLFAVLVPACGSKSEEGSICLPGQTQCENLCVDLQTNPAHCGSCGSTCDDGFVCLAGSCQSVCGVGLSDCGGACVDTNSNPAHCGGCDSICAAGGVCQAGNCQEACADGLSNCDGACVDTNTNLDHCGLCDQSCRVPNGLSSCTEGSCSFLSCNAPWDDCDQAMASGCETRTDLDAAHCGGCGQACLPGESCAAGECRQASNELPAERAVEPLIISGENFPALAGWPVDQIFVFRFDSADGWQQIAHQVDERRSTTLWDGATCPIGCELRYVFDGDSEGNGLDEDDELVLLASDLGEEGSAEPPAGTEGEGYRIRVELAELGVIGNAYVFASSSLAKDYGPAQVSYTRSVQDTSDEDTEVITPFYRVHYRHLWVLDVFEVSAFAGGDGVDLIDRWKARAYSRDAAGETEDVHGMCGFSDTNSAWGDHIYLGHIDGPVRAIRGIQGACSWSNLTRYNFFYPGRMDKIINLRGHSFSASMGGLWLYWDFSEDAAPLQYYSSLTPNGSILDGVEDPNFPNGDVGSAIEESWSQVDSQHGGMAFAFRETIDVPGPLKGFIWDDANYDDGTGKEPGTIGGIGHHLLYVASTDPLWNKPPAQVFFTVWPLPAGSDEIGANYAATLATPLQRSVSAY